MSPRKWIFRLEDIYYSLDMISQYVEGLEYESWRKDRKTIDAVIRNIEIIGEAASHLPNEFKELHVDIRKHSTLFIDWQIFIISHRDTESQRANDWGSL
ncbi:MAG: HepT-like ribonuclease domain-containing protein [Pseudomonadota bacterium]|nr:HepT-like ribonuclease domain-containing protein [Pseudomonadota bacterium]